MKLVVRIVVGARTSRKVCARHRRRGRFYMNGHRRRRRHLDVGGLIVYTVASYRLAIQSERVQLCINICTVDDCVGVVDV